MSADRAEERFMRRALELASVPPFTSRNPRVGCVVVRDGKIIGEGYHEGAGRPHAEVRALADIDARGATVYVTLEPCVHHGRTPPCAPLLVDAGVARVVTAMEDPDRRVRGKGHAYLAERGVAITTGVLAGEASWVNAPYIRHRLSGFPFVTLKLALSLDGRMAAPDGSARWITGEAARRRVHARRVEVDAVLLGSGTIVTDDPQLTARAVEALRQPVRVIVDSSGRVAATARVFAQDAPVMVATTDASTHEVQTAWKEAGAEVLVLPPGRAGVDLTALLEHLGAKEFIEIYCEGGARLATSLLAEDLVDRLELHYGPLVIGAGGPELGDLGTRSIADAGRFEVVDVERLHDDLIVTVVRRR